MKCARRVKMKSTKFISIACFSDKKGKYNWDRMPANRGNTSRTNGKSLTDVF
jgi:hypothetical protein